MVRTLGSIPRLYIYIIVSVSIINYGCIKIGCTWYYLISGMRLNDSKHFLYLDITFLGIYMIISFQRKRQRSKDSYSLELLVEKFIIHNLTTPHK